MHHNLATSLLRRHGSKRVTEAIAKLSVLERAALCHHWPMWARPKQLLPNTNWRTHGFLTGRGFGKTRANAEHIIQEAYAGHAMSIGLAAQNEDRALELLIHGKSGLIDRVKASTITEDEAGQQVRGRHGECEVADHGGAGDAGEDDGGEEGGGCGDADHAEAVHGPGTEQRLR